MHKYKIVKLDGRHKGFKDFEYLVSFYDYNISEQMRNQDFEAIRIWCWESWGPGNELDYAASSRWAWWREDFRASIYFNEPELAAYMLQWS